MTEPSKIRLRGRCVGFELENDDDINLIQNNASFRSQLEEIATKERMSIAVIDRTVFLKRDEDNTNFDFRTGMISIKKMLKFTGDLIPISSEKPFPEKQLRELFPDGEVDEDRIRYTYGRQLKTAAIRRMVKMKENAVINRQILNCKNITELAESGTVSISHLASVQNGLDLIKKQEEANEMLNRTPLTGSITLSFRNPETKQIVCEIEIRGFAGDTTTKRRHVYIYSMPGYGKSYMIRKKLLNDYRCVYITDIKNATDIPDHIQFLVIDEYGGEKKSFISKGPNTAVLDIDVLKGITSGNASSKGINRKSHGASFVPCEDAQLIILSNVSIYEAHSKYSNEEKRRVIDSVLLKAIDQRFFVHCVDEGGEEMNRKNKLMVTPYGDMHPGS